jgi:hypothetical protein
VRSTTFLFTTLCTSIGLFGVLRVRTGTKRHNLSSRHHVAPRRDIACAGRAPRLGPLAASTPASTRAFYRPFSAPRSLEAPLAPRAAPDRPGRRAGPSVRRLPPRTRCPGAPYHGAIRRLAPLHEVALLFKAATLLPAQARHASARAIRRRHWRPLRRAQGRPAVLPHWASPTSPGTY